MMDRNLPECGIASNRLRWNLRKTKRVTRHGRALIWPLRLAHSQKLTQFSDLFLGMVPQIFHDRRLFWGVYHHYVSPPHSAYLLLIGKDVENRKMFRSPQQFSRQIGLQFLHFNGLKHSLNKGGGNEYSGNLGYSRIFAAFRQVPAMPLLAFLRNKARVTIFSGTCV